MTNEKIQGGYILIAKKMMLSDIMKKPPLHVKLFLWMLNQASYKDTETLKRGEFITSITDMQNAMTHYVGFRKVTPTIKQIRVIYEALVSDGMISISIGSTKGTMKGTTKGTTKGIKRMNISILNYSYYQTPKNYEGHNEGTHEGPTKGHMGEVTPIILKERKKESEFPKKNGVPYQAIIDHLNAKTGKRFSAKAKATQTHIHARWNEGYKLEDFLRVVDVKVAKWKGDSRMETYLRPETLFGTKFDSYLNEQFVVAGPKLYEELN